MIKDSVMVSEYNVRFFKLDLHVSMAIVSPGQLFS